MSGPWRRPACRPRPGPDAWPALLEHVHRAGASVSVREVAEALELNISTAHHLVNTLVWEGYLVRAADRRLTPGRVRAFGSAEADGPPALWRALGRAAYAADDVALRRGVPGAASARGYPFDTLALRGYLSRTTDPDDRRRVNVTLSDRGHEAADAVLAGVMAVDRELSELLGAAGLEQLRVGLTALCEIRDRMESQPFPGTDQAARS